MITRRAFVALAATAIPGIALRAQSPTPLGAQLYSVRELAEKDLPATLQQVRSTGYQEVELYAALYKYPAPELRSMVTKAGLQAPSGIFSYSDFAAKVPYAQHLGLRWMVCPMLPPKQQNSAEGFSRAAQDFNRWARLCKAHGLRFAFHNYNYEFQNFNGSTGFDILLKETDPDLVFLEMDCYWIAQAGRDPVLLLNQLGKRVRMLHLKDRKPNVPTSQELNEAAQQCTEIGRGTIHYKELLPIAQQIGVEHYFVEQNLSDHPIESLRISYENLHRILP